MSARRKATPVPTTSKTPKTALQMRTSAALKHQQRIVELSHLLDAKTLTVVAGFMEYVARQRGAL